jgi:hypothetical protein
MSVVLVGGGCGAGDQYSDWEERLHDLDRAQGDPDE